MKEKQEFLSQVLVLFDDFDLMLLSMLRTFSKIWKIWASVYTCLITHCAKHPFSGQNTQLSHDKYNTFLVSKKWIIQTLSTRKILNKNKN